MDLLTLEHEILLSARSHTFTMGLIKVDEEDFQKLKKHCTECPYFLEPLGLFEARKDGAVPPVSSRTTSPGVTIRATPSPDPHAHRPKRLKPASETSLAKKSRTAKCGVPLSMLRILHSTTGMNSAGNVHNTGDVHVTGSSCQRPSDQRVEKWAKEFDPGTWRKKQKDSELHHATAYIAAMRHLLSGTFPDQEITPRPPEQSLYATGLLLAERTATAFGVARRSKHIWWFLTFLTSTFCAIMLELNLLSADQVDVVMQTVTSLQGFDKRRRLVSRCFLMAREFQPALLQAGSTVEQAAEFFFICKPNPVSHSVNAYISLMFFTVGLSPTNIIECREETLLGLLPSLKHLRFSDYSFQHCLRPVFTITRLLEHFVVLGGTGGLLRFIFSACAPELHNRV